MYLHETEMQDIHFLDYRTFWTHLAVILPFFILVGASRAARGQRASDWTEVATWTDVTEACVSTNERTAYKP